ncbi:MAG: radical SAM protein [Cetobacterium sp.]|uniref:radical SAM protein n=1 Tax=Cetobacterium sp. TaxID=2071632 RepID=UPI003F3378FC
MLNTKKGDVPLMNIYLSNTCNMNCKYCFDKNNTINKNEESLDDTVEKINKILKNYKIVNLELSGREISTCYKDYDYVLSNLTKECKINDVTTVTNGLEINEEFIAFIKKHNVKSVVVSLDIGRRVHNINRPDIFGNDTYDKIFKNIILLRENGIDIRVSSVYDEDNKPTIDELKEQIISLNTIGVTSMKIAFKNDTKYTLSKDVYYIHNLVFEAIKFMNMYNIFMILKLGSGFDFTRIKEYSDNSFTIDCNARRSATVSRGKEVYSCMLALGNKDEFINKTLFEVKSIDTHKGNLFMKDFSKNFECMECKINVFCRGACPILHIGDGKNVCIPKRKTHVSETITLWNRIIRYPGIFDYIKMLNSIFNVKINDADIEKFKKVVINQKEELNKLNGIKQI